MDSDLESGLAQTPRLRVSNLPEQEYSWEWGAFPQRSEAFPMGKEGQWNTVGKSKGKTRIPTTSDVGHEKTVVVHRRRSEVDISDLEATRSHSVPPDMRGAPIPEKTPFKAGEQGWNHDLGITGGPLEEDQGDLRASSRTLLKGNQERRDHSPGFGHGGQLRASRRDTTKFRVSVEGRTMAFEVSILPEDVNEDVFNGRDEMEAEKAFDHGKVDLRRFLEDETVINHEWLTIRWANTRLASHECSQTILSEQGFEVTSLDVTTHRSWALFVYGATQRFEMLPTRFTLRAKYHHAPHHRRFQTMRMLERRRMSAKRDNSLMMSGELIPILWLCPRLPPESQPLRPGYAGGSGVETRKPMKGADLL